MTAMPEKPMLDRSTASSSSSDVGGDWLTSVILPDVSRKNPAESITPPRTSARSA